MERNLVDGVASAPLVTWVALSCQQVTKYVIDHPYYHSTQMALMNMKSWTSLPEHLQDLMMDKMMEYPKYKIIAYANDTARARVKMLDAGIEFYRLSPEVADWFLKTAYDAAWEYQQKRFPKVSERNIK